MNIRERLDSLSRGELAGLVVVIVLLLAAVGFWYTRSLPRPIDIATNAAPMAAASSAPSASVAVAPSASTSASPSTTLIVDVTGWVRKPGVFAFEPGDRVIDAVERAGGARDNADLTLLNLAAPLVDGQQILVPKEGAQAPGTVPTTRSRWACRPTRAGRPRTWRPRAVLPSPAPAPHTVTCERRSSIVAGPIPETSSS